MRIIDTPRERNVWTAESAGGSIPASTEWVKPIVVREKPSWKLIRAMRSTSCRVPMNHMSDKELSATIASVIDDAEAEYRLNSELTAFNALDSEEFVS